MTLGKVKLREYTNEQHNNYSRSAQSSLKGNTVTDRDSSLKLISASRFHGPMCQIPEILLVIPIFR